MKQPNIHAKLHSCRCDNWDPYKYRNDLSSNLLDEVTFNLLLGTLDSEYIDPSLFVSGCLDAPDEIPCGSTERIGTLGGFEREAYNRHDRGCTDWMAERLVLNEVACMLKEILAETV